jgi:hypothetical protein
VWKKQLAKVTAENGLARDHIEALTRSMTYIESVSKALLTIMVDKVQYSPVLSSCVKEMLTNVNIDDKVAVLTMMGKLVSKFVDSRGGVFYVVLMVVEMYDVDKYLAIDAAGTVTRDLTRDVGMMWVPKPVHGQKELQIHLQVKDTHGQIKAVTGIIKASLIVRADGIHGNVITAVADPSELGNLVQRWNGLLQPLSLLALSDMKFPIGVQEVIAKRSVTIERNHGMNTKESCRTFFSQLAKGLTKILDGKHLGSSQGASGDCMRKHMCIMYRTKAVNLCLDQDWAQPFMHSTVLVMLERRNPGAVARCQVGEDEVRNEFLALFNQDRPFPRDFSRYLQQLSLLARGEVRLLTQMYGVDPDAMCHHNIMPSGDFKNEVIEATGFQYRL